jgi:antirestriction protein ArdC
MRKKSAKKAPDWAQLLIDAVENPGTLSSAYRQFWNYSVGNQLLALFECLRRGLQPGPIHTFRGWLELGRHVKKGEQAITLCMPVQVKRKRRQAQTGGPISTDLKDDGKDQDHQSTETVTVFTLKPRWFVLSQTDGGPYVPTELPAWSEARSLQVLSIQRIEFTHTDGNCQGFARQRQVSVSPIAFLPHKTLFHELAHVALGHTAQGPLDDHDRTPRSLREVEAESVALICCESLDLPGATDCRGYIQHWLDGSTIPEASAQKIFKAADAILKAGYSPSSD